MQEPLKHFVDKFGIDISKIDKIVSGIRYSAVLLKNGNIGVCSNLSREVNVKINDLKKPDLDNIEHRIIINAYFNASLNYLNTYDKIIDLYDGIDFKKYNNIVMIGLFKPILKKFERENIKISIFDKMKQDRGLISMKNQKEYISKADSIILSGTTIFNKTFLNIVNNANNNCDIFLLGPSSIMNEDMFKYKNIKVIFGSTFKKNDKRVLDVIEQGFGTQKFLPFGYKVCL